MIYEIIVYVLSFVCGIYLGKYFFKSCYVSQRYSLSLFVLVIPSMILGFMTMPTVYPEYESIKFLYLFWMFGVLLAWGYMEHNTKKTIKTN